MPFSRFRLIQNKRFDFLGFEFRWGISRKGKPQIIRRTSRKKLEASIASFTKWIKTNRNKKISKVLRTLKAKYRGYWNYYGVVGNQRELNTFYYLTRRILFKWLNRLKNSRFDICEKGGIITLWRNPYMFCEERHKLGEFLRKG